MTSLPPLGGKRFTELLNQILWKFSKQFSCILLQMDRVIWESTQHIIRLHTDYLSPRGAFTPIEPSYISLNLINPLVFVHKHCLWGFNELRVCRSTWIVQRDSATTTHKRFYPAISFFVCVCVCIRASIAWTKSTAIDNSDVCDSTCMAIVAALCGFEDSMLRLPWSHRPDLQSDLAPW